MEYKKIAEEIDDDEIKTVMNIIYGNVEVIEVKRLVESNFLVVFFYDRKKCKISKVDLLPDDVYQYDENTKSDGDVIEDGEIMYEYRQFMIARGYSDYWLNNQYII